MSGTPFEGCVAIDTNVFLHLLNPQNNPGEHINQLLDHLDCQMIALIVDDKERISGEYNNKINPILLNSDDTREEIYILRSFFGQNARRHKVSVTMNDDLMRAIRNVMPTDSTDRIFVYVAFKEGKILISNDRGDIVNRRQTLLNDTRQIRRRIGSTDAEILTSQEAHDRII